MCPGCIVMGQGLVVGIFNLQNISNVGTVLTIGDSVAHMKV